MIGVTKATGGAIIATALSLITARNAAAQSVSDSGDRRVEAAAALVVGRVGAVVRCVWNWKKVLFDFSISVGSAARELEVWR
jgi:hypothetical protein